MNYEMLKGNATCHGCPYREWGWHDGGPDFKCLAQGGNRCCVDSYSDFYHGAKDCEFYKSRLKTTFKLDESNRVDSFDYYTGA